MTTRYENVEFHDLPEFLKKELKGYRIFNITALPSPWSGGTYKAVFDLIHKETGAEVTMTIEHNSSGCCGNTPSLQSLYKEPINNEPVKLVHMPLTKNEYRLFLIHKRFKTVSWEFAARKEESCVDTGEQYRVIFEDVEEDEYA